MNKTSEKKMSQLARLRINSKQQDRSNLFRLCDLQDYLTANDNTASCTIKMRFYNYNELIQVTINYHWYKRWVHSRYHVNYALDRHNVHAEFLDEDTEANFEECCNMLASFSGQNKTSELFRLAIWGLENFETFMQKSKCNKCKL